VPALLSAGAAVLHSLLTTAYMRAVSSPGEPSVVIGLAAVERQIAANGGGSYLLGLVPFFVLACVSCWVALALVRIARWSWPRLVAVSGSVAVAAAIVHRFLLQVTVERDFASGDAIAVSGLTGVTRAVETFGIGSVILQLLGYALIFLLPIVLSALLLRPRS
jgi:hypothetical protein